MKVIKFIVGFLFLTSVLFGQGTPTRPFSNLYLTGNNHISANSTLDVDSYATLLAHSGSVVDLANSTLIYTAPINNGGTGQTTALAAFDALSPMTTAGDMIIQGSGGTAVRLAAGSGNTMLVMNNGYPYWGSIYPSFTGNTGKMLYNYGSNVIYENPIIILDQGNTMHPYGNIGIGTGTQVGTSRVTIHGSLDDDTLLASPQIGSDPGDSLTIDSDTGPIDFVPGNTGTATIELPTTGGITLYNPNNGVTTNTTFISSENSNITITLPAVNGGGLVSYYVSGSVSLASSGNTTIYTPPAGVTVYIQSIQLQHLTVSGSSVPAAVKLSAGPSANLVGSSTTLTSPVVGTSQSVALSSPTYNITSSYPLVLQNTAGTEVTHTVDVIITFVQK